MDIKELKLKVITLKSQYEESKMDKINKSFTYKNDKEAKSNLKKELKDLKNKLNLELKNNKDDKENIKDSYVKDKIAIIRKYKGYTKDTLKEYKIAYKEYKKLIKESYTDDKKTNLLLKLELSLSNITDLSIDNITKENSDLKKLKKQYKKYDNNPHPSVEDRKNRSLAKYKYQLAKNNFKSAYKIAIKQAKLNDESVFDYKMLSRFYSEYIFYKGILINRLKNEPLLLGRDIIVLASILSLALSLTYIRAIKQVPSDWVGIFMFGFILFGLVSIFNVIRLKEAYSKKYFFALGILILSIICGLAMIFICIQGITPRVKTNLIYQGIILAVIICVAYIIGMLFITKGRIKEKRYHILND